MTIVSVCGSIVFFSYSNVSVCPDLTSIVPGEKYMLSWMYLFGDIVTPASFAFTTTPLSLEEPNALATKSELPSRTRTKHQFR